MALTSVDLPEGVNHYDASQDMPYNIQKYNVRAFIT